MSLEKTVNRIIENSHKIEQGGLGTILPHTGHKAKQIDRLWDKEREKALNEAARDLVGMRQELVGGEVRYYKTETIYTVVPRHPLKGRKRNWFEHRADGHDYSIPEPN